MLDSGCWWIQVRSPPPPPPLSSLLPSACPIQTTCAWLSQRETLECPRLRPAWSRSAEEWPTNAGWVRAHLTSVSRRYSFARRDANRRWVTIMEQRLSLLSSVLSLGGECCRETMLSWMLLLRLRYSGRTILEPALVGEGGEVCKVVNCEKSAHSKGNETGAADHLKWGRRSWDNQCT